MEEKKLTDEVVAENATTDEIIKAINYLAETGEGRGWIDGYKCKVIKFADVLDLIHRLQDENERLTAENEARKGDLQIAGGQIEEYRQKYRSIYEENAELQKQVDELKDERENMQAEILRFEDMKFTQKHCDLYSENETLKQWLKRLNADLEYEKNWGKIQTKQAVKDTAKEIIRWIKLNGILEYGGYVIHDSTLEGIGKKYGVEVE